MSKLKKILIVAAVFIVAVITLALLIAKPVSDSVNSQLEALRKGDLVKAYALTSRDFQKNTSLDNFKSIINIYPVLKDNASSSISKTSYDGDLGSAEGTLKAKDGTVSPVEYRLIKEEGEWRVVSIKLSGLDITTQKQLTVQSATKEFPALTRSFSEKGFGFTINYPDDWVYQKQNDFTVIFSGKEGTEGFYSTVSIQNIASTKIGGKYETIDAVTENFKNQLKTVPNSKVTESEDFDWVVEKGETVKGKMFLAEYIAQGQDIKQRQMIIPRADGKIFYAISYTSPLKQYDTYLPIASGMLKSWTVTD